MIERKGIKYCFLDLETTCLSPSEGEILEVAAIICDHELNELERYESTIYCGEFPRGLNTWTTTQHTHNGLLDDCKKYGVGEREVFEALQRLFQKHLKDCKRLHFAGNSFHFDRSWIKEKWPSLLNWFHHRILDVSSFHLLDKSTKGGDRQTPHRAMCDLELCLKDARRFYDKFYFSAQSNEPTKEA